MLPAELAELVRRIQKQKPEGQTIEIKSAHEDVPKRLYDTLSSFSNQDQGGIIVFGIDELKNYAVAGIYDPQDLQKKVTEQCSQMEPPVRALFTIAEIDGKQVCSAEIPSIELSERPCYYKGAGKVKGSYIRVGDADQHMTDHEIYSFEAYRRHRHDDERPAERASMNMLDRDALQSCLAEQRKSRPKFASLPDSLACELLNISRSGKPTLAAIMNFCVYPQGYYPQLCITAVSVPGTQIGDVSGNGVRFLDNSRIEGTISSMADQAVAFCLRNMKVRTVIDPRTGRRDDRTEYPVEAIREAVLNALIHRDYSTYTEGTPVQLDLFTDRLEVHSPGCLYGGMNVEQLGYAKPELRNPALAVMAEKLTGAENRYSGIPTMRRAMKEFHLPEPQFENRRDEFVVTFYNTAAGSPAATDSPSEKNSASQTDLLLDFCKTPRTRQELADFLGRKTVYSAIRKFITPLVKSGRLEMTIPEKPKSKNQRYRTRPQQAL